ncbi:MAG: Holliday junction resolvase RuvX [Panacagrimonas sp.]
MPIYLAFDYGLRRIGVAVGDDITGAARALKTIDAPSGADWHGLENLLREWRPNALIVGLPLNDDGSDQEMATQARAFADGLETRSKLPVHLADERFSSRAADDVLRDARASGRMSRRVRKGDRDSQAARVILQQWLDMSADA